MAIVILEEPKIENKIPKVLQQLTRLVKRVLENKKFLLIFGGEDAITINSLCPFKEAS
ncbi:hypothetical protein [Coxiella endosymbiont of Rhipicephalus microplus]|uniref:hypothetical protein n=1 Tax=Coxiella endosymbiont of Rhipicephalus microplus TaxID=1656186 RepID=UPI0012FFF2C9|nr:hypothetical protein [Coxiella endosymbiont of Rhipicephalus microplus]